MYSTENSLCRCHSCLQSSQRNTRLQDKCDRPLEVPPTARSFSMICAYVSTFRHGLLLEGCPFWPGAPFVFIMAGAKTAGSTTPLHRWFTFPAESKSTVVGTVFTLIADLICPEVSPISVKSLTFKS